MAIYIMEISNEGFSSRDEMFQLEREYLEERKEAHEDRGGTKLGQVWSRSPRSIAATAYIYIK